MSNLYLMSCLARHYGWWKIWPVKERMRAFVGSMAPMQRFGLYVGRAFFTWKLNLAIDGNWSSASCLEPHLAAQFEKRCGDERTGYNTTLNKLTLFLLRRYEFPNGGKHQKILDTKREDKKPNIDPFVCFINVLCDNSLKLVKLTYWSFINANLGME